MLGFLLLWQQNFFCFITKLLCSGLKSFNSLGLVSYLSCKLPFQLSNVSPNIFVFSSPWTSEDLHFFYDFRSSPLGFSGLEGDSVTSDGVERTASFLHDRFVNIPKTSQPRSLSGCQRPVPDYYKRWHQKISNKHISFSILDKVILVSHLEISPDPNEEQNFCSLQPPCLCLSSNYL